MLGVFRSSIFVLCHNLSTYWWWLQMFMLLMSICEGVCSDINISSSAIVLIACTMLSLGVLTTFARNTRSVMSSLLRVLKFSVNLSRKWFISSLLLSSFMLFVIKGRVFCLTTLLTSYVGSDQYIVFKLLTSTVASLGVSFLLLVSVKCKFFFSIKVARCRNYFALKFVSSGYNSSQYIFNLFIYPLEGSSLAFT